jgi:hypothetical protein
LNLELVSDFVLRIEDLSSGILHAACPCTG